MNTSDLFWNASHEELKRGYTEDNESFICLLCGKKIEKGIIYRDDDILYEALRYIRIHIEKEHGSVFGFLTGMDKRLSGLTDHQKALLYLFYQGKSDAEVQEELNIGSASTIRNHRFALKEKERQAKVFLALMELLKEKDKNAPSFKSIHKTAKMADSRYDVTNEESAEILKKFFPDGIDGHLKTFAIKEKYKIVVLGEIAKKFQPENVYNEKEVNEILKLVYDDFATIRRYLIEYGFLDRTTDGGSYWVKENSALMEKINMDRKKELKQQYKEMKTEAGIYQIRNTVNNKVFVVSTPNFKTMTGRKLELISGGHKNIALQDDFNKFGQDSFVFEKLEILEEKEEGYPDINFELKMLFEKWLEKIQPYGEKGYNRKS
jgi:hypothetical protein